MQTHKKRRAVTNGARRRDVVAGIGAVAVAIPVAAAFSAGARASGDDAEHGGTDIMIIRINTFKAKAGDGDKVKTALEKALSVLNGAEGHVSHQVLQAHEAPDTVVVIENWASVEAHQAAAGQIPRDDIAAMMELLAEPPSGQYFH